MDTRNSTSAQQQSVLQIILLVDACFVEVENRFGEFSPPVAVGIDPGCTANLVQNPVKDVQLSRAKAQAVLIIDQHFELVTHELPLKTLAATEGRSRQLPQGNMFVGECNDFIQNGPDVESGSTDMAIAKSGDAARRLKKKKEEAARLAAEKAGA